MDRKNLPVRHVQLRIMNFRSTSAVKYTIKCTCGKTFTCSVKNMLITLVQQSSRWHLLVFIIIGFTGHILTYIFFIKFEYMHYYR